MVYCDGGARSISFTFTKIVVSVTIDCGGRGNNVFITSVVYDHTNCKSFVHMFPFKSIQYMLLDTTLCTNLMGFLYQHIHADQVSLWKLTQRCKCSKHHCTIIFKILHDDMESFDRLRFIIRFPQHLDLQTFSFARNARTLAKRNPCLFS